MCTAKELSTGTLRNEDGDASENRTAEKVNSRSLDLSLSQLFLLILCHMFAILPAVESMLHVERCCFAC